MLALIRPLRDHHSAITDPRHPQQRVLDLPKLDPKTTDLQLRIPTAQKLQLPVRPPTAMITTAIPPHDPRDRSETPPGSAPDH